MTTARADGSFHPKVRTSDVSVDREDSSTQVYDQRTGEAWSLTGVQANVFASADGSRNVAAIAEALREAGHAGANEDTVRLALIALGEANLLEESGSAVTPFAALTRRGLLARLGTGVAAAAAPALATGAGPGAAKPSIALGDLRPVAAEKVTICHKPGTAAERTLRVPASAVRGHLAHGDTLGACGSPPPEPPGGGRSV